MGSILDRRLVYVTGKGGVGRTTVCAALGLAAATHGRRVIICEVAEQDRLSRLFEHKRRHGDRPAELADRVWGVSIDPQAAFQRWLSDLVASRRLVRLLLESQTFGYFAAAAPGSREIATLARVETLVDDDAYDLVVVDAPASGHGLGMLRTPRTFGEIARVGPVRAHTERLAKLLGDAERTAYLAVTQAEDMAVNETLDLEAALPEVVDRGLEAIVVNALYPQRFEAGELERAVGTADRDRDGSLTRALAAARTEHRRATGQQEELARLKESARAPIVTLPYVYAREVRRPQLEDLAGELERGLLAD